MSVKHNKAGGGNAEVKKELQEVKKETQEVKAAGESTAALLAMYFKAQIVQDRAAGTEAITDEMILQSAEVIDYPEYEDAHAYNTVGEIIKYNGRYYEIIAPHTSNSVSYPVETTFAYYRLVELEHTGRLTIRSRIRKRRELSSTSRTGNITATREKSTLQKLICRIAYIRPTRLLCGNGKK